eukprot:3510445-Alexandrium_andersonii.AAC.1
MAHANAADPTPPRPACVRRRGSQCQPSHAHIRIASGAMLHFDNYYAQRPLPTTTHHQSPTAALTSIGGHGWATVAGHRITGHRRPLA